MVLLTGGAATISHDRDIVIDEIGVAAKRLDAGIGGDACQQQTADLPLLQDTCELRVRHRTVAMLDHDGLPGFGPDFKEVGAPASRQATRHFHTEPGISFAHRFRQTFGVIDGLNEDHQNTGFARRGDQPKQRRHPFGLDWLQISPDLVEKAATGCKIVLHIDHHEGAMPGIDLLIQSHKQFGIIVAQRALLGGSYSRQKALPSRRPAQIAVRRIGARFSKSS